MPESVVGENNNTGGNLNFKLRTELQKWISESGLLHRPLSGSFPEKQVAEWCSYWSRQPEAISYFPIYATYPIMSFPVWCPSHLFTLASSCVCFLAFQPAFFVYCSLRVGVCGSSGFSVSVNFSVFWWILSANENLEGTVNSCCKFLED